MHDRRARYVRNHDGDSVVMMLDQDFLDTKTINIRLANVWAPELNENGGAEVMFYVHSWLLRRTSLWTKNSWPFIVITYRTRTDREQMTLGRYVADVMSADGKDHLNSDVMKFVTDHGYSGGIGSRVG